MSNKKKTRFSSVIILIITLIFCMSFGVNAFGDTGSQNQTVALISVTVQNGDSLWNLIQEYNPQYNGDMNEAIYFVKKINNLDTSGLYGGQILQIPIDL